MLTLAGRRTLVPAGPVDRLARLLRPLFWSVTVVLVVEAAVAGDWAGLRPQRRGRRRHHRADPPRAAAGRARPDGVLDAVPRGGPRHRRPVRRRPARRHRDGPVRRVARVLHRRHGRLPAQPGRPAAHRPRRGVLQPGLPRRPARALRVDRGAGARHGGDPHPPRDPAAAAADRPAGRLLHHGRPGRGARPLPLGQADPDVVPPRSLARPPGAPAARLGPLGGHRLGGPGRPGARRERLGPRHHRAAPARDHHQHPARLRRPALAAAAQLRRRAGRRDRVVDGGAVVAAARALGDGHPGGRAAAPPARGRRGPRTAAAGRGGARRDCGGR